MDKKIKNIVFDLGGVLVDLDFKAIYILFSFALKFH